MDENVDEMIPAERAGVRCRSRQAWCSPKTTVTVEVEQPKIKTVAKCTEDGDFYSHERPVCVPETCDVRIAVVTILKYISGVWCLRHSS